MSSDDTISKTKSTDARPSKLNRRNILLGGTTLAAASSLGGAAPIQVAQAQAQQQPAPTGRPPNILIIWGDDIATGTSVPTTRA